MEVVGSTSEASFLFAARGVDADECCSDGDFAPALLRGECGEEGIDTARDNEEEQRHEQSSGCCGDALRWALCYLEGGGYDRGRGECL